MNIRLEETIWVINDGEYYIVEGESVAYIVRDGYENMVYYNDNFKCCLTWIWNSL